jgi:hypothetical protein
MTREFSFSSASFVPLTRFTADCQKAIVARSESHIFQRVPATPPADFVTQVAVIFVLSKRLIVRRIWAGRLSLQAHLSQSPQNYGKPKHRCNKSARGHLAPAAMIRGANLSLHQARCVRRNAPPANHSLAIASGTDSSPQPTPWSAQHISGIVIFPFSSGRPDNK